MKDNTIVDKLARTLERPELGKGGVTPLAFVYTDLDTQNIVLDNIGTPFVAVAPVASSAVIDDHGRYHEQATFEVYFGDLMCQSLPDYSARENERIIDECKQRAFKWLASFYPADELQLVSINNAQRSYMQFDAITTGILFNVTIYEAEGHGKC